MTHPLSDEQVRLLRARAQGLDAERPQAGVDGVVRRVIGVQAQVASAGALSVRARSAGIALEKVERAGRGAIGGAGLVHGEQAAPRRPRRTSDGCSGCSARSASPRPPAGARSWGSARTPTRALAATVAALGDLGPLTRAELAAEPREPRRRRLETRLYGAAPEFDIDAHALTPARTPESQSLVTALGRSSTEPLGRDQVAPSRETHAPAQAAGERLEREIDACEGGLAATHSRLEGLGFLDRVRHGRALCEAMGAEQRALRGLRRELAHQRVEGPAPQSA